VTHVEGPIRGRVRRHIAATASAVVLLAATTACTSGSEDHKSKPEPSQTPTSAPSSAPFRVSVTHVSGKLSRAKQNTLARRVRAALSAYVDAAFLGGKYPRTAFTSSFGSFTGGAAHDARHDLSLLTNRPYGASTTSVRAVHRTAYLSVLAPKDHPAGVTAAVNLVFQVDRGDRPSQRVHLKGRLLLTHGKDGGRWSIFGYDLSRWQVPKGGDS
jgi:hypothetical protein